MQMKPKRISLVVRLRAALIVVGRWIWYGPKKTTVAVTDEKTV